MFANSNNNKKGELFRKTNMIFIFCSAFVAGLEQNSPYLFKVKASNARGESKFTEEIVAMTKVDAARIPVPRNVHFEKSTQKASFSVRDGNSLELIGKCKYITDEVILDSNFHSFCSYD